MQSTWPQFENDEISAVTDVLQSRKVNYWSGQECKSFEKEFSSYLNTKYAISVSNGTVAIELALAACEIGAGDEVITTCRTFLASASAIVMRGAKPVGADDINSQNITLDTIGVTEKTRLLFVFISRFAL